VSFKESKERLQQLLPTRKLSVRPTIFPNFQFSSLFLIKKDTNLRLERVINDSIIDRDFFFLHATESFNAALLIGIEEFCIVLKAVVGRVIVIETIVGRFEVWCRLILKGILWKIVEVFRMFTFFEFLRN
jgi:hypothetical protein